MAKKNRQQKTFSKYLEDKQRKFVASRGFKRLTEKRKAEFWSDKKNVAAVKKTAYRYKKDNSKTFDPDQFYLDNIVVLSKDISITESAFIFGDDVKILETKMMECEYVEIYDKRDGTNKYLGNFPSLSTALHVAKSGNHKVNFIINSYMMQIRGAKKGDYSLVIEIIGDY